MTINNLYHKHKDRELTIKHNYIYIKKYENDIIEIITIIKEKSNKGLDGYENFAKSWINKNKNIDDEYKKKSIQNLFCKSKVAVIYGAAGTGKSTIMNYISNLFSDKSKIFLAQTNPTVENIKRKINNSQNISLTIEKFKK